jgi:cell division septation protein DedD
MRRGRIISGVTAAAAAALLAAPAALAATPQQIYRDAATHGKLTRNYSAAQLQAALKDATVQGYGGHVVKVVIQKGAVQRIVTGPSGGVAGAQQSLGAAHARNTLPFTGAQLWLFALVGLALIAGGALLKTTARQKSRS